MSEEPSSNSTQDLFFFFVLVGGLFILWLISGGSEQMPIIKTFQTQSELHNNKTNNLSSEKKEIQTKQKSKKLKGIASPYEGMVKIRGGQPRERHAQAEYLELKANHSNKTDILITGWTLESVVTRQHATIGKATRLPYPGKVNITTPLILSPGDSVIVNTGYSPIGINFKTNLCVGYFDQFQNFSPRLRQECVNPVDEFDEFSVIPVTNVSLENDKREICRNFIRRNINRCEINNPPLTDIGSKLDNECLNFVEKTYTYSGCVANHIQDLNFFKNKWRVFLNSPTELWREERETIRLLDQNGRTVDIYDY